MKRYFNLILAFGFAVCGDVALADSVEARCDIYPRGEDHTDVMIPCNFSQRQGYITITRSDGVTHVLSPVGDAPGNFVDQHDNSVLRESGLGDQGQIFRFQDESVYVYWDASIFNPVDEDDVNAPFTTSDYDATTQLRCKKRDDSEFGSCAAGILRMDNGQASIVVQNQLGEQFTINFMSDYVNATNCEVEAHMENDTWILNFANGEVWEVPLAAIEGG